MADLRLKGGAMGEAKRRAENRAEIKGALQRVDIPRLALAMRKLAIAASGHYGADCYVHAALPQVILAEQGVKSRIKIGFAGWRVGNGDGDVVMHRPVPGMIPQPGSGAYHVWLEVGQFLLDFTTYQLRDKAVQLDALDGGHTTVEWCPDYLFVPRKSVSGFWEVTNRGAGLYYYEEVPSLTSLIITRASVLDPVDVQMLQHLYRSPGALVLGPNDCV